MIMETAQLQNDKKGLGDLLVGDGILTAEQLQHALREQSLHGNKLEHHLVKLGYVDENTLACFVARQYQIPFVYLSDMEMEQEAIDKVPVKTALELKVMPMYILANEIAVALADPSDLSVINKLEFITGLRINPFVALKADILNAISQYYHHKDQEMLSEAMENSLQDSIEAFNSEYETDENLEILHEEEEASISDLKKAVDDAPIIKLTNFILKDAISKKASDIHIEPFEKTFRIRFRIDGVLKTVLTPPHYLHPAVVSRFKIMCDLDITERRLPQDGRMMLKIDKKAVDFRVSFLPGLFGEKVVIRILDKSDLILDMRDLGLEGKALEWFERAIHSPNGMILVTGPTGSGKTTTLYSALTTINTEDVNIITAEDPAEFNLEGITQVQMKEKIGLTFPTALRSFLRQDPDIMMVGEIRDLETANIAIKATLTGHLVFSTLHTIDAPSTIIRLINMGIEPILVSSSVILVVAQRLLRTICRNCKQEENLSEETLLQLGITQEDITGGRCYRGRGCDVCSNTGYKGRVAIYEVMPMTKVVKELLLKGATTTELRRETVKAGMDTLRVSGLKKVTQGISTLEEVLRVTVGEEE
jgi:type IV pilus assembly protein PilB